jgi:hypothetical protein
LSISVLVRTILMEVLRALSKERVAHEHITDARARAVHQRQSTKRPLPLRQHGRRDVKRIMRGEEL